MKNVDYLVVGSGYAAMFFAQQLIRNGKSFLLFADGEKSASQVSAGIINPVVLKKFTTFWLAQEQIDFLKITLNEISQYTGENYLIDENIHRIFHDEKEKDLWLKKAKTEELAGFLDKNFNTIDTVNNPFGTGKVNQSARLNVLGFFNGMMVYLEKKGNLIREKFDYTQLKDNSYRDISFTSVVFCEGIGVKDNPFFKDIPVNPNKGHHLTVKLSENLREKFTLKKKHFLFPLNDGAYYYGGTYDRFQLHNEIDDSAKEQLTNGLSEFYPFPFDVLDINFGFRPTVSDRRPILGSHPDFSNYYVFNGLGARGILNGCYFSRELFEHIETGKPLHPEVNVDRFK